LCQSKASKTSQATLTRNSQIFEATPVDMWRTTRGIS
jgi:hypothetical protein